MSVTIQKNKYGYYLGLSGSQFDDLGLSCGKNYFNRNVYFLDKNDILEFDDTIPYIIGKDNYIEIRSNIDDVEMIQVQRED